LPNGFCSKWCVMRHLAVLSELRLNSIKSSAKQTFEILVISIVRMKYQNSLCSLFAIQFQLPKLNVAGSIPVSRSKNQ